MFKISEYVHKDILQSTSTQPSCSRSDSDC